MRIEYFKALLRVTKDQARALVYEDIEQMRVLVEEKQILLDTISKFNGKEKVALSEEEKALLIEIQELDTKNSIEFKAQMNYAKEEVRKANVLIRRDDYYTNPYSVAMEGGIFFDRK